MRTLVTGGKGLVGSAIESNFIQTEIGKSAYEYQKKVDNKDRTIVGVNKFMTEDSVEPEILNIDSDKIENQKKRLKRFKENRDNLQVENALNKLKKAIEENENLIPFIISAVKSKTTLGEISDSLREIYGEYNLM